MWAAVLAGAAGCYALKLLGLSVPRRWLEHPLVERAAALIPVALLGALAALQTIADDKDIALDARVGGVAVAVVCIRARAPFLVVVASAAATSALLRLV